MTEVRDCVIMSCPKVRAVRHKTELLVTKVPFHVEEKKKKEEKEAVSSGKKCRRHHEKQ